jgi:hypothetical protein
MCRFQELTSLAVSGLVSMFDESKQLFCQRLLWTDRGPIRKGLSCRDTIIALLGLRELQLTGVVLPFDLQAIYASFMRHTNWIRGIGDLGLLIWLKAAFHPEHLEKFVDTFDSEFIVARCSNAQESRTIELSLFLIGLAHAAETSRKLVSSLADLCVTTYHRIEENQDEYGLFGRISVKKSMAGRLRGSIGSFADQAYPIYAMSKFAGTFHVEDPLGPALQCATAICGTQGSLGQWWCLYDSGSGRVSKQYPVYSVNQYGLAPMALFAIEAATGQCFQEFIQSGLRWIYGDNELGTDMRDSSRKLIWRGMVPVSKLTKYFELIFSTDLEYSSLVVLREQRLCELGWLLLALASHTQPMALA